MREAPYPLPPEPALSEADGMQSCLQTLHECRGETSTEWEILDAADGEPLILAIAHPNNHGNTMCATMITSNQARQVDDWIHRELELAKTGSAFVPKR